MDQERKLTTNSIEVENSKDETRNEPSEDDNIVQIQSNEKIALQLKEMLGTRESFKRRKPERTLSVGSVESQSTVRISTPTLAPECFQPGPEHPEREFENFVDRSKQSVKLSGEEVLCKAEDKTEKEQPSEEDSGLRCFTAENLSMFDTPCVCMLCCYPFDNTLELQAHLASQKHASKELFQYMENYLNPKFDCLMCGAHDVTEIHQCLFDLSKGLKIFITTQCGEGSPLTCILCKGRPLKSVHHLMIHVVTNHGFLSNVFYQALNCPICFAVFNTRNSIAVESHALEVHLPELVIKKQKLMHAAGKEPNLLVRHFVCHFENKRYRPSMISIPKTACYGNYTELPSLISHLEYAHYPVPNHFKVTKNKPVSCNACLIRFPNRVDLREHAISAHFSFLRYRSHNLPSCLKHCEAVTTCHLCWTQLHSSSSLQTHILVYHVGSWHVCGFCDREFCGVHESVTPAILYMTMERHVQLHTKQLKDHFRQMFLIFEGGKIPVIETKPTSPSENFFATLEITKRKKEDQDDKTRVIMEKLGQIRRRRGSDSDYEDS